jgi:hypothetical protein
MVGGGEIDGGELNGAACLGFEGGGGAQWCGVGSSGQGSRPHRSGQDETR